MVGVKMAVVGGIFVFLMILSVIVSLIPKGEGPPIEFQ